MTADPTPAETPGAMSAEAQLRDRISDVLDRGAPGGWSEYCMSVVDAVVASGWSPPAPMSSASPAGVELDDLRNGTAMCPIGCEEWVCKVVTYLDKLATAPRAVGGAGSGVGELRDALETVTLAYSLAHLAQGMKPEKSAAIRRAKAALAAAPGAGDRAGVLNPVERIETVPIEHPFSDEKTPPVWRVSITLGDDIYCADFDYEEAANNWRKAILSLSPGAGDRETAGVELRDQAEAGRRYWAAMFHVGICEAHARDELLEDGTHSEEEHLQARSDLAKAREALSDAEREMCRQFSDPSGYPIAATALSGGGASLSVARFDVVCPKCEGHPAKDKQGWPDCTFCGGDGWVSVVPLETARRALATHPSGGGDHAGGEAEDAILVEILRVLSEATGELQNLHFDVAGTRTYIAIEKLEKLTGVVSRRPGADLGSSLREVLDAADLVARGWKAGRILADDEGEDRPDGDMVLGKLYDAMRSYWTALAAHTSRPLTPAPPPLRRRGLAEKP